MRNIVTEPEYRPATLRALRREARRLILKIPLEALVVVLPLLEQAAESSDDVADTQPKLRLVDGDGRRRKASM